MSKKKKPKKGKKAVKKTSKKKARRKRSKFTLDDLCEVPTKTLVREIANRVDVCIMDLRLRPDLDPLCESSFINGDPWEIFQILGEIGIMCGDSLLKEYATSKDEYRVRVIGAIMASATSIRESSKILMMFDQDDARQEEDEKEEDEG